MPEMPFPIGPAELVADQPVDGPGIGDAQQRLGEAQERHALLRGQRVFVQKRVDAALAEPLAAHRDDEAAGALGDPVAHFGRDLGRGEDPRHRLGLVDPGAVADRGAQRRRAAAADGRGQFPCRYSMSWRHS